MHAGNRISFWLLAGWERIFLELVNRRYPCSLRLSSDNQAILARHGQCFSPRLPTGKTEDPQKEILLRHFQAYFHTALSRVFAGVGHESLSFSCTRRSLRTHSQRSGHRRSPKTAPFKMLFSRLAKSSSLAQVDNLLMNCRVFLEHSEITDRYRILVHFSH